MIKFKFEGTLEELKSLLTSFNIKVNNEIKSEELKLASEKLKNLLKKEIK